MRIRMKINQQKLSWVNKNINKRKKKSFFFFLESSCRERNVTNIHNKIMLKNTPSENICTESLRIYIRDTVRHERICHKMKPQNPQHVIYVFFVMNSLFFFFWWYDILTILLYFILNIKIYHIFHVRVLAAIPGNYIVDIYLMAQEKWDRKKKKKSEWRWYLYSRHYIYDGMIEWVLEIFFPSYTHLIFFNITKIYLSTLKTRWKRKNWLKIIFLS